MASGDVANALGECMRELSAIDTIKPDRDGLAAGDPTAFLPLIHYTLLEYSAAVARWIAEKGYTLAAKSDLRFAEEVWRIAIRELALRPPLSVPQFLSDGYAVPKLQLLRDLVAAVRARSERALQPWASRQGANGVHTRRVRPRPPTSQPEAPPQSDRFQPRARALRGWSTGVEAAAAAAAAAWPATRSAAPLLRESKARRSTSAHRAAGTVVPPALVSTSASASVSPSSGPASASPASIYRYASFGPPPRTAHQHPASKASLPVREPQPSAGSQDSDALEHGAGVAPLHEHTCSRRHHQLQSSLETCVCHIQEMTSRMAALEGALKRSSDDLNARLVLLEGRVATLEHSSATARRPLHY